MEALQVDHSNKTAWLHTSSAPLALDGISGIFCSFSVDLLLGTPHPPPPPEKNIAQLNVVTAKSKLFKQDSHKTMCTGNAT